MTTGWPRNQQDLRWPNADNDDTGPASSVRGRLATETDPKTTPADDGSGFSSAHPSGPLPVGRLRDPQERGRFGRKSRGGRDEFGPEDAAAGDADYDWIKYLGEAGPAQESSRRPAEGRDQGSADDERGGLRGAGRRLSRRHGASGSPAESASVADSARAADLAAPVAPTAQTGPTAPTARVAPPAPTERVAPLAQPRPVAPAGRVAPPAPTEQPRPVSPPAPTPAAPSAAHPAPVAWPEQKSKSRFDATADTDPASRVVPADWARPDPRSDSGSRMRPEQSGPAWPQAVRPEAERADSAWPQRDRPDSAWPERPEAAWPHDSRSDGAAWGRSQPEAAPWASSRPQATPAQIGRPDIDLPGQNESTRPPQERQAPAAEAKTVRPPHRHRSHRATADTRRADTATSPVADARATEVDSPRSGLVGPDGAAAVQTPVDRDERRDLAPANRVGRGKAARPAKQARKARRDADRDAGQAGALPENAVSKGVLLASAVRVSAAPTGFAAKSAPPTSLAPTSVAPDFARQSAAPVGAETASGLTTRVPAGPAKSATPRTSTRSGSRPTRRRFRHPVHLIIGGGVVVILALVAVLVTNMMGGSAVAHSITTPSRLNAYALQPQLAQSMGAAALRADIVSKGNGEASNVKDAVYEVSTGPAAKAGPLFVLFIGGNLSGSASSFISSFTGLLPGAFMTSPGSLGGQAACVPGYAGHPAECAWADNDTFGLFASPDLSVAALGSELRAMRPLVEHVSK